ncbi:MAG: hypothetical protein LBT75_01715 [Bacilli bacterium]|jgi:hypothetical protein|nr:hypothetical protein [Bacilli bacterium]
MKKIKLIILSLIMTCFASGISVNAATSDIMDYYFSIFQGRYTQAQYYDAKPHSAISFKNYAGTNKKDKSAYVINSTSTLNFYQYLGKVDSSLSYSDKIIHKQFTRSSYINKAPRDTSYGHVFYASRENVWDGRGEISGSWSCDDKNGK